MCYLHSEMLEKARPVLEQMLEPGTLVISNVFDIPGWEPEIVHRIEDSFCPQVYVYRVPDHKPVMKVLDGGLINNDFDDDLQEAAAIQVA